MLTKFLIFVIAVKLVSIGLSQDTTKMELVKSFAPDVTNPITRNYSVTLQLSLNVTQRTAMLDGQNYYRFWNYDNSVPGPFIRTRVNDTVEVSLTNYATLPHGIDFHSVSGPGGGEAILLTPPNSTKKASFKMLMPGVYVYHCGSPPVPTHLANGLYGLIMVEPPTPLPPVDKEFYLMRSEFYTEPASNNFLQMSAQNGINEDARYVVFNGKTTALTDNPLTAKTGDKIRIYVGNAGPNQVASFHIIGVIFSNVYREGDLMSPPAKNIQTTLIPAGGSAVVEFEVVVPGAYAIVDHSIFRINKGALGLLVVEGPARTDIYCKYINDTCQSDEKILKSDSNDTMTTTSTIGGTTGGTMVVTTTHVSKNDAGGQFLHLIYLVLICKFVFSTLHVISGS